MPNAMTRNLQRLQREAHEFHRCKSPATIVTRYLQCVDTAHAASRSVPYAAQYDAKTMDQYHAWIDDCVTYLATLLCESVENLVNSRSNRSGSC